MVYIWYIHLQNKTYITCASKRVHLSYQLILPLSTQCLYIYRRDVPIGVPLDLSTPFDLSTPMGMSFIGTYCKSDSVSKYCVLIVAFQLLWHEELMSRKKTVNS